jgi:selenocysteine-specific elongation factor
MSPPAPAAGSGAAPDPIAGVIRRVVVGTAGHIDHGKTRLVEALTGIDCDRWAEEKERGITIDLGFAHLERELPDGSTLQIGFIDVPGHERFLRNALAGLGGIRVMLLVVAADEGVKPQTREHLAICSLLGIPAGLVALTKVDLVEPDLVELARLEIEELLEPTLFAGSRILPVSSVTGAGLEELERSLVELATAQARSPEEDPALALPARLPIDRAFHLKGLGVIVTGTLTSGRVTVGDSLEILPEPGTSVRVRSIQVHGRPRTEAVAGERSALQLAGVGLEELARGEEAAAPGRFEGTRRLLAEIRLLPDAPEPLRGFTPVRLHLLSSEVLGKIRPLPPTGGRPGEPGEIAPGGSGLAEIRLSEPVVAIRGDRLILRRPSPETTLGGGRVLDPRPGSRRLREMAAAGAALRMDGLDPDAATTAALLHWAREAGAAGLAAEEAARRLGVNPEEISRRLGSLVGEQKLLAVPAGAGGSGRARRWIAPTAYREITERAAKVLAAYFERDRLARGIPKAEAVRRIFPGRGAELADVYLGWLAAQEVVAVDGDLVTLPGRRAELTGEESSLARAVVERFAAAGLTPGSPEELGRELGAKPQILDGVVRYLTERGRLVRLPGGLVLAASSVESLRDELEATGWERFSVPQFKDRFGLSRKWAIPLLEHLDSTGVTRRLGDERMIVKRV